MIKLALAGSKASEWVDGELATPFNYDSGARQGDVLWTLSFNITLEAAVWKLNISGY